jgi:hypothetical protein
VGKETTILQNVKTEVANAVTSYFAPVKAVISQISKAVVSESQVDRPKEK